MKFRDEGITDTRGRVFEILTRPQQDKAEQFLRGHGFQPLRVRYHQGDMARIEVAPEAMAKFADPDFRRLVVEALKAAGYTEVDAIELDLPEGEAEAWAEKLN